ncbi:MULTISPECIES: formyltetrahydrofolate deformylase [unclassified Oceanispirochaeta]|uniref:formyltetrahydrofolate deformylase n=1 Tax=unclassified Oceanispirochaeta TaxID=2635722 RepID=UPI000E09DCD7|nr:MULTISPECIES: formyltetrahydrofolate deformylase [unclassified Oceanispirochaeta]MBF9018438.1 formyltetrahydrofolate deformylase [Oceanispirochaeta sp. M2]NPD73890.1 formyltetrahydrofolate deformylase [Oceanispirochaeta sp. M1]RDG30350.1 formyltetrahydrofolate deformylase [Oceanispirochaeta sp. M1]
MNRESAILFLSCMDRKGIVAEITHFITMYEGNILNCDQHYDESGMFFMRVEWDMSDFAINNKKIESAFEPIAVKFEMDWRLEFSTERATTAILVSKYDHCLYELLIRNKAGELKTDIKLIMSNHEDCRPIAEYFNIPFHHFPVSKDTKAEVEKNQIALLNKEKIDLIVLARYMQILSGKFIDAFPRKIINIHHSFLPAFVGAKPYHQAFSRGVKLIGATSHYVTEDLDQGPIIAQDVARVNHRDNVNDLIEKGRNLEKSVLSRAVQLHLEHKILVFGNKTIVFD